MGNCKISVTHGLIYIAVLKTKHLKHEFRNYLVQELFETNLNCNSVIPCLLSFEKFEIQQATELPELPTSVSQTVEPILHPSI